MSNNSTNGTQYDDSYVLEYQRAMQAFIGTQVFLVVVGTFLNIWLIACILTSPRLRGKLRNQLICNISVMHLTQTLIKSPIFVAIVIATWKGGFSRAFWCHMWGTLTIIECLQTFVANWMLVTIVAIFLAHVVDYDPETKLTPRSSTIGRIAIHAWPWVVSTLALPVGVSFSSKNLACMYISYNHYFIFEIVYTVIPIGVAVVVVVAATILRFRRFSRGSSSADGNMGVQLMGKGPEIDNAFAYILSVALAGFFEVFMVILSIELAQLKYRGLGYHTASYTLSESRVIFLLLPWLLLPDIRERLRSWRPWRNSGPPGIDLSVAYNREC